MAVVVAMLSEVNSTWMVLGIVAGCGGNDSNEKPPDPPASCVAPPGPASGKGTYYDADGTGNCSFDASSDHLVAAINGVDYGDGKWCGACLRVTGPNGDVVVRVTDKCPNCAQGDLDLSREAFEKIAPLSAGRVDVTWEPVACEVTGPISYKFKDGSNADWTAVQLRNHRYPITSVEAKDASGTYKPIGRQSYNYFVAPRGLGAGPIAFRVTDTRGHVVEESIMPGDNVSRAGATQFPTCP